MKLKLLVTSCWLLLCLIAYAGHSHPEICTGTGYHQLYPALNKQDRPLQYFSVHTEKVLYGGRPCCPCPARPSTTQSHLIPVIHYMHELFTNM